MACSLEYRKVMQSIKERHPTWSVKTRQRIARAVVYGKKKKK